MAFVFLARTINKVPSRLYYQTAVRNTSILACRYPVNIESCLANKMFIQTQLINPNRIIVRSEIAITIKEYKSSRKYTGYWRMERLLGWTLFIMIPSIFAVESKELEMIVGLAALGHGYLGCQSMCTDYVRSAICGKVFPVIVRLFVTIVSIVSLAGCYQLVYEDIGIANMIKKFWAIRGKDYEPPEHLKKVIHEPKKQRFRFFSDK